MEYLEWPVFLAEPWLCTGTNEIYQLKFHPGWDFPGGAAVKNPPANAGDKGSSPGLGRSHMPWSN